MLRALDDGLLRLLRTRAHSPAAERAARALAHSGEQGLLWHVVCALGPLLQPRQGAVYRRARRTLLAVAVSNYALKLAVGRPRPRLEGLPPLTGTISGRSYPSAHAATAFAAARVLSDALRPPPLYTVATAIALTRPYLGVHYPSDVLAGALLGDALGRLSQ